MPRTKYRNHRQGLASYTDAQSEWLREVGRYQSRTGDRQPTAATVLRLARALGYRQTEEPGPLPRYRG